MSRSRSSPTTRQTEIEERVEPNLVYTLKNKLDAFQVYWQQEVEDFAKVFFKPAEKQREQDKGLLHKFINPSETGSRRCPKRSKADFRHQLGTFLRLYAFLSQMVDFKDPDLEKLYAFGRLLITKCTIDDDDSSVIIDDEVKLAYYRLTKTHEGTSSLTPGETATVSGPTDVGTGRPREPDLAALSEIVQVLNDKFGTDFKQEDQLLFDQVVGDLKQDDELGDQAKNNTIDQFKLAFDPKAMAAFVERMERNEDIASKFLENEELRNVAMDWMMQKVFSHFKTEEEPPAA